MPSFFSNKTLDRNALFQKLSQPIDKREGYDFNLVLAILAFSSQQPTLVPDDNLNKNTIGLNLLSITSAVNAWITKTDPAKHISETEFTAFQEKLYFGMKNIREYCRIDINECYKIYAHAADPSPGKTECIVDSAMDTALQYFLQDEHAFAYMLGKLLMVLYIPGIGLVAVQFFLPFIVALPLELWIASVLAVFALFSYLAYASAKGIPGCLITLTSWWKDIKKLWSLQKVSLLVSLFNILGWSWLSCAEAFIAVAIFSPALLTALGISSAIYLPIAILLCIGMFITSAIISMQFFWGLFVIGDTCPLPYCYTNSWNSTNKPLQGIVFLVLIDQVLQTIFSYWGMMKYFTYAVFPISLIFLFVGLVYYFINPYLVRSGSLEPTFSPGDFVIHRQLAYGWLRLPIFNTKILWLGEPKCGDIAYFHLRKPGYKYRLLEKRVIGVPGNHIVYHNKKLTINGQEVPQESLYLGTEFPKAVKISDIPVERRLETLPNGIKHEIFVACEGKQDMHEVDLVVPEGEYFMMGDNRASSYDSRYFKCIPITDFCGDQAVGVWKSQECKQDPKLLTHPGLNLFLRSNNNASIF